MTGHARFLPSATWGISLRGGDGPLIVFKHRQALQRGGGNDDGCCPLWFVVVFLVIGGGCWGSCGCLWLWFVVAVVGGSGGWFYDDSMRMAL